jgi:hypothetical protein
MHGSPPSVCALLPLQCVQCRHRYVPLRQVSIIKHGLPPSVCVLSPLVCMGYRHRSVPPCTLSPSVCIGCRHLCVSLRPVAAGITGFRHWFVSVEMLPIV